MAKATTPADLTITPRDLRFGRGQAMKRWWLGEDPIATAFYNSLSVTFPKGEGFFIDSVRLFRDGTPPRLAGEIQAFIKQEVMHTREHAAFNRHVTDQGYDISKLEAHLDYGLSLTRERPPIANLAATMALEHFTAIMAHEILANPTHFERAEPEAGGMWRWHAVEEIEHKGVAYDTWLNATKDWSRFKRWKVKSLIMLRTSMNFANGRRKGMLELLRQDGLEGPYLWWRIFWFAFGRPGIARRVAGAWLSYFMPGFHPWKHDDRHLIRLVDSQYQAAILPQGAATA